MNRYRLPLAVAALAGLSLAGMPARGAAPVRLQGSAELSWTCVRTGAHPAPTVYLRTDSGERVQLELPAASRVNAEALGGQQLEVLGERKPGPNGRGVVVRAQSVRALAKRPRLKVPHTVGQRRVLTLLLRFAGTNGATPFPPEHINTLMSGQRPGLADFYREISYGQLDVENSAVTGWLDLPKPMAEYVFGHAPDFGLVMEAAEALVGRKVLSSYDNLHFVFNVPVHENILAIGGYFDRGPRSKEPSQGYIMIWPTAFDGMVHPGTLAHEMGHTLNWGHSHSPSGWDYDSLWDVMSDTHQHFEQPHGFIPQGTLAYNRVQAGWLPKRVVTAKRGRKTRVTLGSVSAPGESGPLMVKVPVRGSKIFYTVEVRRQTGYDAILPAEGVLIHRVVRAPIMPEPIVQDGTPNDADPNDEGGVWTPGETFRHRKDGVTISVKSAGESGYEVTIVNGRGK
ncbi:MAG: hypothetical protein ACK47B_03875 [Armatimonadota bacterium]